MLQPLREMGDLLSDLSMALPYRAAQSNFDPFFAKGGHPELLEVPLPRRPRRRGLRPHRAPGMARPHPLTLVHVPQMGGATSRIAADESAFGDRSAAYMLSVDGNWIDAADDGQARHGWTRDFVAEAAQLPGARGHLPELQR